MLNYTSSKIKTTQVVIVCCLDSLDSSLSTEEIEDRPLRVRMWCPFNSDIQLGVHCVELFGSCNCLLFLRVYEDYEWSSIYDYDSDDSGDRDFLFVWNPATREYKEIVPYSPNTKFHWAVCISGLGYDDTKILRNLGYLLMWIFIG